MKQFKLLSLKRLVVSFIVMGILMVAGTQLTTSGTIQTLYDPIIPNPTIIDNCGACQDAAQTETQSIYPTSTIYDIGWPIGYKDINGDISHAYFFLDSVILLGLSYVGLSLLTALYIGKTNGKFSVTMPKNIPTRLAQTARPQVNAWSMAVIFVLLGGLLGAGVSFVAGLGVLIGSSGPLFISVTTYGIGFVLAIPLYATWKRMRSLDMALAKKAAWSVITPVLVSSFFLLIIGVMNNGLQAQNDGTPSFGSSLTTGVLLIGLLCLVYGTWAAAMFILFVAHYAKLRQKS